MTKHQLSPDIVIIPASANDEYNIPDKFLKDYFVLHHEQKDTDYLINATIHFFIQQFISPTTLEEVIAKIQKDLSTTDIQLEETCKKFYDFLLKRKILVKEGTKPIIFETGSFFQPGDCINGLIIEKILSLRGNVDIYQALDQNTGNIYAIKSTNRKKIKNDYAYTVTLAELEREFLLLKRAEHIPQVCKAFSFVKKETDYAYICLEFIQGKSLNSYINKTENITTEDIYQIIKGMVKPFAELHSSKIIHGDIHSSNIIIGENNQVKIIDLGFSRIAELEKDQLIKHGGVNNYMPPERINITSHKKYAKAPDLYSDVYQIGILLYLALFNNLPFEGFTWEELAENIKTAPVIFPSTIITGEATDANILGIIEKCLSKEPSDRYENAEALYSDIINLVPAEKTLAANLIHA